MFSLPIKYGRTVWTWQSICNLWLVLISLTFIGFYCIQHIYCSLFCLIYPVLSVTHIKRVSRHFIGLFWVPALDMPMSSTGYGSHHVNAHTMYMRCIKCLLKQQTNHTSCSLAVKPVGQACRQHRNDLYQLNIF